MYMGSAPRHEGLFSYVDDFSLLATGRDHATVKGTLQRQHPDLQSWPDQEGLRFDPGKTEYLTFGRSAVSDRITLGTLTWLGVTIDHWLSFKPHAERVARKASRMAGLLKRVSKYYKGLPLKAA